MDGLTGRLVDATLFEGLSEKNIHDHEIKWVPALEAANKASKKVGGAAAVAEDAHWRWSRKVNSTAGQLAFRHYVIEHKNLTGRVGLHALPNAASWYRDKLKLTTFGQDASYHDLEHFELSEEQSEAMLNALNNE